ncbi:MAG: hypothetical protein DRP11_00640 [Candidatus Aenigmatarchaeota archaeon]|nr:MAG: hypothetical protein DRP11_00640 [Candidatus Aenigmarchaeota archaeon]
MNEIITGDNLKKGLAFSALVGIILALIVLVVIIIFLGLVKFSDIEQAINTVKDPSKWEVVSNLLFK